MPETTKRVLVADAITAAELEPLRALGVDVVDRAGISPEELKAVLPEFDGLLVRSRTKVTAPLLAAAPRLKVVGRAGTGVDNVDLDAATERGIVVMNVPGGNVVAAAEQTLALLFALVRHTVPAAMALREGKWEQKPFVGTELTGKTLGILGLGRIGREVAKRARGLGMRVVAYDPIVGAQAADELGVELASLDAVAETADIVTVHVPLAPMTRHLVDARFLAKARRGVRILNVARGGIVDEAALLHALESGHVAGAGLDVFEAEPPKDFALVRHPRVVATPHLGASTVEAQSEVARQIGIQVGRFLVHGAVENAVNLVGCDAATREAMTPWMRLARRLGGIAGALLGENLQGVEFTTYGAAAAFPRATLLAEALVGILGPHAGERLNQVNAVTFARNRAIAISERTHDAHKSFHGLLRVAVQGAKARVSLSGTLFGHTNLRIVRAFGLNMDAIPEGPLLFVENDDRPGVVGRLGTLLADAGINIAGMNVGRDAATGRALSVLNLDQEPSRELLAAVSSTTGVRTARLVPRAATV